MILGQRCANDLHKRASYEKQVAQIYTGARGLVKKKKATSFWTSGGKVYIRLTEEQGRKAMKISSLQELCKYTSKVYDDTSGDLGILH